MKTIKKILGKINKNTKSNKKQITWLEYRDQWLIENRIWSCEKKIINIK